MECIKWAEGDSVVGAIGFSWYFGGTLRWGLRAGRDAGDLAIAEYLKWGKGALAGSLVRLRGMLS